MLCGLPNVNCVISRIYPFYSFPGPSSNQTRSLLYLLFLMLVLKPTLYALLRYVVQASPLQFSNPAET